MSGEAGRPAPFFGKQESAVLHKEDAKMIPPRALVLRLAFCGCLGFGCGTDPDQQPNPPVGADAQTPPTGQAALDAWLATGVYKAWACESGPMNARPNGAHGRNRVCSNSVVKMNTGGEYAVGAASVKELFDSGSQVTGYAVSRHMKAGTTADTWYWYEKVSGSVVADGISVSLCNGCHSAAGTDAAHQGHDYVYVQVQ